MSRGSSTKRIGGVRSVQAPGVLESIVMSEFALKTALPAYLREEQNRIERLAAEAGLDFFPTVFEILTYDQMNEIAAYGGFPSRYPHWRFGMEYEQLSKSYEYGLSKIFCRPRPSCLSHLRRTS